MLLWFQLEKSMFPSSLIRVDCCVRILSPPKRAIITNLYETMQFINCGLNRNLNEKLRISRNEKKTALPHSDMIQFGQCSRRTKATKITTTNWVQMLPTIKRGNNENVIKSNWITNKNDGSTSHGGCMLRCPLLLLLLLLRVVDCRPTIYRCVVYKSWLSSPSSFFQNIIIICDCNGIVVPMKSDKEKQTRDHGMFCLG